MSPVKKTPRLILFIAAIGLLLTACQKEQAQAPGQRGPIEVDVITLTPSPTPVPLISELPGRTAAFRTAEVRPQVSGIIKERLFNEGSEVTAGQLLYQIDPSVYQAAHDSAKAQLAKAKALEVSAQQKAERYRKLIGSKAISEQQEIDADAEWQQAKAEVAVAEAALATAKINLDYTRVVAPISGRIGRSMVSEGSLVTAQQATALATIQQIDPLYVDLNQSSMEMVTLKRHLAENAANNPSPSSQVTVILEDGSPYDLPAELGFTDISVNESTGTVTLRAIVPNPQHLLLPGMYVRAKVEHGLRNDAILIPAASVSRDAKGQAMVMVVDGQQTVQPRPIRIEQHLGDKVLVAQGLTGGEQLIVAGLQRVRPGVPVKPVPPQEGQQPDQVSATTKAAGTKG